MKLSLIKSNWIKGLFVSKLWLPVPVPLAEAADAAVFVIGVISANANG